MKEAISYSQIVISKKNELVRVKPERVVYIESDGNDDIDRLL